MGKTTSPRSHKARPKPSTPESIAYARAQRRGAGFQEAVVEAFQADGQPTPAQWGINPDLPALATAANVQLRRDVARKVTGAARRSVFDTLHATKDGNGARILSTRQLEAANRLADDLAKREHTCGSSEPGAGAVDTSEVADPMDARIKASDRIDAVLGATGASSAALILALIDPKAPDSLRAADAREAEYLQGLEAWDRRHRKLCALPRDEETEARITAHQKAYPDRKPVVAWRETVATVTKITNAPAQVAVVVVACENLAAAYAAWDRGEIHPRRRVAA